MEFTITLPIEGIRARLEAMVAATPVATVAATIVVQHIAEREIKDQLRKTSHLQHTRTPSQPGQPPSKIDGSLVDSVKVPTPTAVPGHVSARIGPTAVYSRIQELGGMTGRGGRVKLPARPYLRPAVEKTVPQAEIAYVNAWRGVCGG